MSINHAFAYGRPYFTLQSSNHGPEISYIRTADNGAVLERSFDENVQHLSTFMLDRERVNHFCIAAAATGEALSVERWADRLKAALSNA